MFGRDLNMMKLIIDTDAGVDDAQAIMMALTHPGVDVAAITTLIGNVHVDWVTQNVAAILHVMAATAPIYRGADRPLLPGAWEPLSLMGADGLGNYQPRPAWVPALEAEHAAVALVRMADEAPGVYTLVALGPMTNIALACRLDPGFPDKVKGLVFMGGTIAALGNTPNIAAEYNIYIDPEAALIVLDAFPDATMISWETTLKHGFTWSEYDTLAATPTKAGRFLRDITRMLVVDWRGDPLKTYLIPDPLAMAVTLEPGLIVESQHHYVTVEVQGTHTRGQTIVDYTNVTGKTPNVQIVTEIDTAGVYRLFEQMLA